MCTITLEYNQNNALARRKLAALLATGLFLQKEVTSSEPSDEEEKLHREEMKAFLAHSKKSMSTIIARYLWSTERDVIRRLGTIKEKYFNEIVDKIVVSIF